METTEIIVKAVLVPVIIGILTKIYQWIKGDDSSKSLPVADTFVIGTLAYRYLIKNEVDLHSKYVKEFTRLYSLHLLELRTKVYDIKYSTEINTAEVDTTEYISYQAYRLAYYTHNTDVELLTKLGRYTIEIAHRYLLPHDTNVKHEAENRYKSVLSMYTVKLSRLDEEERAKYIDETIKKVYEHRNPDAVHYLHYRAFNEALKLSKNT